MLPVVQSSSLKLKETSAVVNNVPRELLTNHHYPLMEYKHETSIILLPVTAMLIIYFHSHVTPRSAHRFYTYWATYNECFYHRAKIIDPGVILAMCMHSLHVHGRASHSMPTNR